MNFLLIITITINLYISARSFTIFYDKGATWETDFIVRELFSRVGNYTIELLDRYTLTSLSYFKLRNGIVGKNAFIFSSHKLNYEKTLAVVKYLQPKVIIHLSDEGGRYIKFDELRHYTKYFMRQHCHGYDPNKNDTAYIPLAYISGMYANNPAFSSTYIDAQVLLERKREFIWTFVGDQLKQDRPIMLSAFKENLKPYYLPSSTTIIPRTNLSNIYSNALFVPIGLGYVNHDCFRIYEAASCGSIPVIVATTAEIQVEMLYNIIYIVYAYVIII